MATKSDNTKNELKAVESETASEEGETAFDGISQETDSLMSVAEKLESVSQNFSRQQQEYQQLRVMQQDIKNVLSQIMRGIDESSRVNAMVAERTVMPPVVEQAYAAPTMEQGRGGECGCECVHPNCCCFEIVLDSVRAIQPQVEPADSGELPGVINELEVRLFASVDNIGILVPSMSTTMGLRVGSILLGGKPGPWTAVDRVITRVCLQRGTSKAVVVNFDASEIEEGAERLIGLKDEYGTASGVIMLDCCSSKIYPPMPTDLSFEHGGTGGGVPGMISIAFYARRVCC